MDWQAQMVGHSRAALWRKGARRVAACPLCRSRSSARVETDAAGNVFGFLPAANLPPESSGPVVVLSAHLDTVFPAETPLNPVLDGDRLEAPGACDNGAGVAGMLAIAHALVAGQGRVAGAADFSGQCGRRRARATCAACAISTARAALAGRIAAHIVLDGAGRGLGRDPGPGQPPLPGHHQRSWRSQLYRRGNAQPHCRLVSALAVLAQTPLPDEPRTTLNLGTIRGGTSVNSIPESARPPSTSAPPRRNSCCVWRWRCIAPSKMPLSTAMRKAEPCSRTMPGTAELPDRQDRRPARRATARRLATTGHSCAPWTAIWACKPNCASARPTPISRSRWAFRRVHGRGRRGRRRAHPGRVVFGQGPRSGPEARTAADSGNAGMGRGAINLLHSAHARLLCSACFCTCRGVSQFLMPRPNGRRQTHAAQAGEPPPPRSTPHRKSSSSTESSTQALVGRRQA